MLHPSQPNAGEKSKESALDARDKVTAEMVMKAIQEIAYPYNFKFKGVEWFTCYPIGQRLISRYSLPKGQTENGVTFPGIGCCLREMPVIRIRLRLVRG